MKYIVISSRRANADRALQDLIAEVNSKIEQGWQPIGGVNFSQWGLLDNMYSQAMVHQPTPNSPAKSQ
jgi:hypothetical protein